MSTFTSTTTVRIGCIKKANRTSPHERIRAVGGVNSNGSRWELSVAEAVRGVETGKYRFYVQPTGSRSVWVVVAVSASGHKYLKTQNDGLQPNNLLSLPECP